MELKHQSHKCGGEQAVSIDCHPYRGILILGAQLHMGKDFHVTHEVH